MPFCFCCSFCCITHHQRTSCVSVWSKKICLCVQAATFGKALQRCITNKSLKKKLSSQSFIYVHFYKAWYKKLRHYIINTSRTGTTPTPCHTYFTPAYCTKAFLSTTLHWVSISFLNHSKQCFLGLVTLITTLFDCTLFVCFYFCVIILILLQKVSMILMP